MSDMSQQPYLLRAMHEWMSDNGYTPHIVVNADANGVDVPAQFVEDGRIILNVSYSAAHNLNLDNEFVTFSARFSGKPCQVCVPIHAILGIYARETGQGMVFAESEAGAEEPTQEKPSESQEPSGNPSQPNLRVIK